MIDLSEYTESEIRIMRERVLKHAEIMRNAKIPKVENVDATTDDRVPQDFRTATRRNSNTVEAWRDKRKSKPQK